MRSVLIRLATLLRALLLPTAVLADPMDWKKPADDPESFIGKPVEALGYCAKAVSNATSTATSARPKAIYISTPEIKPDFPIKKIEENCGGLDVVERSEFCRVKISFTPQSVSTSTRLEPGKTITIISTEIATLKF